ncbi:MAG: ATP-grasp domain-containing protein [Clostridiales bacterium]|nr:ATP-grasp domain-containing protein [Clostridiales bacterium]
MNGWLVYERDNIQRNQFFVDRWMQAGARRGIALQLVTTDVIRMGVMDGALFLSDAEGNVPDFLVMRAQYQRLSEHAEQMGIPVYNNARVSRFCNDKRRTHQLLSSLVPMMDTAFVLSETRDCPFPYPVVVKASHACGGRQVHMAKDDASFRAALAALAPDSAVVQPLCDTPGRDVRVYVLGNRIVGAMLRYSESDFRSNVGLGGGSRPYEMDDVLLGHVDRIRGLFRFGLVGVDFLFDKGRLVFNEIEDAVGTRMLYMHTDRDIAADYLDLILSDMG